MAVSDIAQLRSKVARGVTSPPALRAQSTAVTEPTPIPKCAQPGPNPRGAKDIHRSVKEAVDPEGLHRGRSPGNAPKFQDWRTEAILDALRKGNYRTQAAAAAGIHVDTMRKWLREGGENPDSKYRQFYLDAEKASAEAEGDAVAHIRAAFPTDWKACMEFLRRRFPERWAREKVEVTGAGGGPMTIHVVYGEAPAHTEDNS